MNIAIIPARGGSKRILKKNVKNFFGVPIINYSIKAAVNSKLFTKIICSTDDINISNIAKKNGAECPFLRPKKISDDHTTTVEVIRHSIRFLEEENIKFENVCCIYPAAPFIKIDNLKKGLKKLKNTKSKFILSAAKNPTNTYNTFTLNKKKQIELIFNSKILKERYQDQKNTYYDAGQFYWANKNTWKKYSKVFMNHSSIIEIPFHEAIDINTHYDWNLAKKLYSYFNEENVKNK